MDDMITADLHIHSNHSDGSHSPSEVVRRAAARGLQAISVTDHDTISAQAEVRSVCDEMGLVSVSGVEISSGVGPTEVHLLAYGFDADDSALGDFLDDMGKRRIERSLDFIRRFRECGLRVAEDAENRCRSGDLSTRPHLARLLVDAGVASSMQEAFEKYLVEDTQTFIPRRLPGAREVIRTVHAAGGKLSIAHPGHMMDHRIVIDLIASGIDAVEVHHPCHDDMLEGYYSTLAKKYDLDITGGSDYHGWRASDDDRLGIIGMNEAEWRFLSQKWTL